ncbi:MAG TPA: HlyD family secretion protein, partial [Paraburkholderia sp.]
MATAIKQDVDQRDLPGSEPAAPKGGKRKFVLPIIIVLVVLGGIWAFKQWSYGRSHESTDDAAVDGHLVPVLAKVSGYVETVNVSDNDHVKADSTLVSIDQSEYKMRVAQADADYAAARATAGGGGTSGQAQAAVEQASGQRSSLDAQIIAARANETRAKQDLARMEELAGKQVISKMQLDAARAAAEAASANVIAAQRQTSAASGTVASAQAGVRLAGARLQAAQAAVDNAHLQLSYTKVAAPATGIVSRKQVEPGQLVQVGQPLLTIVTDTGVFVTANLKETQLGDIRVGQPVEIEVDAYGGATALGCVESLSAATG